MSIQIDQVRFVKVRVTPKTAWYFAKVVNYNGLETVVEFTKGSLSGEVAKLIHQICILLKLLKSLLIKVLEHLYSFDEVNLQNIPT